MTEKKGPRVPGMVWTILAFVPWILYWVLAGMGYDYRHPVGIGRLPGDQRLPLCRAQGQDSGCRVVGVSLHRYARHPRPARRLVVFYGGVLSDTTLALVGWGSLIVGNPFIYDYAKEGSHQGILAPQFICASVSIGYFFVRGHPCRTRSAEFRSVSACGPVPRQSIDL